ncbi:hypothetical protein EB796_018613 [Bugula neritina]|uniref:Serine aminopeptidase S33 domain-containing protein n=1 Tax=Bugula neritina TaxID=10212 RepID=A0A7J7JAK9_BUGNE|nr:hypothetical protein EB796_018613 [Bugula neritina]
MSKILRAVAKSSAVTKVLQTVETSSLVYQIIQTLPPLSLLVFSFYIGCGVNWILVDALFAIILFIIICALFYYAQDLLLYYPNEPATSRLFVPSPSHYGDLNYENVTITTTDGTEIHAFFIKHYKSKEKPTIIMLHGNAGNIGYRVGNANRLLNECGTNVLLLEYRGYGLSGGVISETGLYNDGISAVKYLKSRPDVDPNRIILHGRSLGGAVAINVAVQDTCSDVQAIIIENTFTTLSDIAKRVLNISLVKYIPDWCYKNKYRSIEKIANVRHPTLFLSGRF